MSATPVTEQPSDIELNAFGAAIHESFFGSNDYLTQAGARIAATSNPRLEHSRDQSNSLTEAAPLLLQHNHVNDNFPAPHPRSDARAGSSEHESEPTDVTFASIALLSPWIPMSDPSHRRAQTWRVQRSRREFVLWGAFTVVTLVFILNLIITILGWRVLKSDTPDTYIRSLYSGACDEVGRRSVITHLAINIMSTLMLGASNLCMQLVVAPTRREVNKAHKKGRWLDIGVPSFRNLPYIPRSSRIVWCLLALTSLPVHFLYNSAVFSTFATNNYMIMVVTNDFFAHPFEKLNDTIVGSGPILEGSLVYNRTYGSPFFMKTIETMFPDHRFLTNAMTNLSLPECLDLYSQAFRYRPNVIMVTPQARTSTILEGAPIGPPWDPKSNCSLYSIGTTPPKSNNPNGASLLSFGLRTPDTYSGNLCDYSQSLQGQRCGSMKTWSTEDFASWEYDYCPSFPVDYCMVADMDPAHNEAMSTCHLQFSPTVILVVTIFNACKCFCVLWVIWTRREQSICTLGDAIASFLEIPDEHTRATGVATKSTIEGLEKRDAIKAGEAVRWTPTRIRWWRASTARRWILAFSLLRSFLVLGAAAALTGNGIWVQKYYFRSISLSALWDLGFGKPNFYEIIFWNQRTDGQMGLFLNILIANIWQVLLSMVYVMQNALLSCLLLADEWAGFAVDRKTLRVTNPRGIQRSSYFVSMPLKYAMPFLAVFAIMHWLLSQCTFIIRVLVFDADGSSLPGWTTAGFSISACLITITLAALMLIAYSLNAVFRKYPDDPAMPLASTCSLAISSNCHRPDGDVDAHLLPVQWGVYDSTSHDYPARCAFTTSRYVKPPEVGQLILGLPDERTGKKYSQLVWGKRKRDEFTVQRWARQSFEFLGIGSR
ncbi:hypothetical protein K402DRAFT_6888 [Aulographum hederae CBS 113979]|uniref:DUF6536 domain-containing protein n=1 Tax=Aulographum hederae CBS 113979 TaxID=1176131 RepID=A0A6G1HGV6_9PEZI|nr:hypothetical protein K402DRAFT_6888 [Aulographum hederae CBS 113979]